MKEVEIDRIQEAIDLFDDKKYKEAFLKFANIYNEISSELDHNNIMNILLEAYYFPNEDDMRLLYNKNLDKLKKYDYFYDKKFRKYDELDFKLFPISDDIYYFYDVSNDLFIDEYEPNSKNKMKYFFENLDEPICVDDEDNFYNLKFLNDNVRKSEDVAMDNHVYLLYSGMLLLEKLMITSDLYDILIDNKFIFLIGNMKEYYPIDFKEKFSIDYSSMSPKNIHIDELKRICYWWKRGCSGTVFGLGILGLNPHIISKYGFDFHYYTKINGYPLYMTEFFVDFIKDVKKKYTLKDIENLYNNKSIKWHFPKFPKFLKRLKKENYKKKYTVVDIFRAYFIFSFYEEKTNHNIRIIPVILWEPHLNLQTIWEPLVL